eukprot:scaffold1_cov375-Pavlova_lutheri.AAC.31
MNGPIQAKVGTLQTPISLEVETWNSTRRTSRALVGRSMQLNHGRRTQWSAFDANDVENIETLAGAHNK